MIQLNHIFYQDIETKHELITDLSISFTKNKLYSILFENYEEGKTLFSILANYISPSSGFITYPEVNIEEELGIIMEKDFVLDSLSFENQLLIEKNSLSDNQNINSIIKLFDLNKATLLKKGKKLVPEEKRILSLTRVLTNEYKVIITFEPSSNLSIKQEEKAYQLLHEYANQGYCVIYLTNHKKNCAFADSVYGIKEGNLLFIR